MDSDTRRRQVGRCTLNHQAHQRRRICGNIVIRSGDLLFMQPGNDPRGTQLKHQIAGRDVITRRQGIAGAGRVDRNCQGQAGQKAYAKQITEEVKSEAEL